MNKLSKTLIKIRQYELGDAYIHYNAVRESINELMPQFLWCNYNYSLEKSKEFINESKNEWENGQAYRFAIVDYNSDRFLGNCSLQNENGVWWMSYWVRSSKRGIAKKAVGQLREWAFKNLKIEKILIKVAKCNAGSCNVAQSISEPHHRCDYLTIRYKVYEAWVYTVSPTAGG